MIEFVNSFSIISDILNNPIKHNLNNEQVMALIDARKAISAIELLGIAAHYNKITPEQIDPDIKS